jgi:archaeosortase A (PGF-CTERM-specific)
MVGLLSDVLAWVVVAAFAVGAVAWRRRRSLGRAVLTAAWGLFGIFWLQLVPHFAFVQKSFVEGIGALVAVPLCWYAGYLLYDGRDSLSTLSESVAWMGAIYLPFETIPAVTVAGATLPSPRSVLIGAVTTQTEWLVRALGYDPALVTGDTGLQNTFQFVTADGHTILLSVVLACTGLGSIALFAGLIAAVDAPLRRKLGALAVSASVIYALNLVRTTFITIVYGKQYMQWFTDEVMLLFGDPDPYRVSFYLSDRVLAQSLSVVALVGVTYAVLRILPELVGVVEDILYVVTRQDHDLANALSIRDRYATDGGTDDVE